MKISPKYFCENWNNLNLIPSYSEGWITGADIVKDRIHGRYLAQIETLEKNLDPKILEFSGFLIMAVDCMVIETLNQFYLGIADTNKVYNGKNKESFRDFFKGSQFFDKDFDDDYSFIFYDHIRNGLLHQARMFGGWKMKKVDMSSEAITRRLKTVDQLRTLCLSLMKAKKDSGEKKRAERESGEKRDATPEKI